MITRKVANEIFNHLPVTKSSLFGIALGCVFIVQMIGIFGYFNELVRVYANDRTILASTKPPIIVVSWCCTRSDGSIVLVEICTLDCCIGLLILFLN